MTRRSPRWLVLDAPRFTPEVARLGMVTGLLSAALTLAAVLANAPVEIPALRVAPLLIVTAVGAGSAIIGYRLAQRTTPAQALLGLFVGATIVTLGVHFAGPDMPFGVLFYIPGCAWSYWLPRVWRFVLVGWVGVNYAVLLALQPGNIGPVARWIIVVATVGLVGSYVQWLMSRIEQLVGSERVARAELAELNRSLEARVDQQVSNIRRNAVELQNSRARIVASADAERRRIERDLHDGAQQHLVAVAVSVRLLKDLVHDDPDAADLMIDELASLVKDATRELRDLAHGIYPPLLAHAGLSDALGAVAARSGQHVEVQAEGLGRFAPEVEAAVYFCCLEALQNSGKHAPGALVAVRLWEEPSSLHFEVVDDGPGFDVTIAHGGHGQTNMGDRLGALGGAAIWRSTPGEGTRIVGSLPLARRAGVA
ncbi:MAG: histidine kinase [Microthrixaceae bacterium]